MPDEKTTKASGGPKATGANRTVTQTDQTPAGSGSAPVDPRAIQIGEAVDAPLTTNPPRGVGEPPSNATAEFDGAREPAAADLQDHVQKMLDEEEAKGYRGTKVGSSVPNEAYTLQGQAKGMATPETTVVTPRSA
jgi:hypothetical protein